MGAANPTLEACILASITKDLESAVTSAIYDYTGDGNPRQRAMTLADGGVELTEGWRRLTVLPTDASERYEAARSGLVLGQIESCPESCGAGVVADEQENDEGAPADEEGTLD